MLTVEKFHEIMSKQPFNKVDVHMHTYLCDGQKDMNVRNIGEKAIERGMKLVILTPHFHKHVEDETASLYEDSKDSMFLTLRQEIEEFYREHGDQLTILLSTEADILTYEGETALRLSKEAEDALDLVTPTVNYHPLLPLKAVEISYGRCIAQIHESGLYQSYEDKLGGKEKVLRTMYETEINTINACPYPMMLGHFFAAHTFYAVEGKYSWFNLQPEHMELMKEGAAAVVEACAKKGAMIDLTGVHVGRLTMEEKYEKESYFLEFQKWFVKLCREKGVLVFPGSDSHGVATVGEIEYYNVF